MKLRDNGAVIDRNLNGFTETNFTFAVNRKSFRVLFNTLYPDKPKAIIRELSTNAFDSHIAAGCPDKPFEITLPSLLNPNFSVRDFGESLTEEGMRIYTTVFESTKDDSDDQVGQLGLGSKSPFAYTDSFSVTVWRDGVKRTYLASLTDKGIPALTEMNRVPSNEPRGVMVSFPVQAKHFKDFREAAEKVLVGFDRKPKILGVGTDEIHVPEPVFAHGNWKVYKGMENHAVRQGCVVYPIPPDQLKVDAGMKAGYGTSKYAAIIDVPIGEVDIAANREALSFDDLTVRNVKAAFAQVKADIPLFIESEIAAAKTRIEAEKLYLTWREMVDLGRTAIKYQGLDLTGYVKFTDLEVLYELPRFRDAALTPVVANQWSVATLEKVQLLIWRDDRSIKRKRERVFEFVSDTASWRTRRRRRYLPQLFVIDDPTPKQIRFLKDRLGLEDQQFIEVGSLPDPGSKATGGSGGPRVTNSMLGVYQLHNGATWWTRPQTIEDKFYWLPIFDAKPSTYIRLEGKMPSGRLDSMMKTISLANEEVNLPGNRPLYLLTPQAEKRLKASEANRWDLVLGKYLLANKEGVLAEVRSKQVRDAMRFKADKAVLRAIGENVDHHTGNVYKNFIINSFLADEYEKARKEGEQRAAELAKEFPLLFSLTEKVPDILEYVNYRKETKDDQLALRAVSV